MHRVRQPASHPVAPDRLRDGAIRRRCRRPSIVHRGGPGAAQHALERGGADHAGALARALLRADLGAPSASWTSGRASPAIPDQWASGEANVAQEPLGIQAPIVPVPRRGDRLVGRGGR